MDFTTEITNYPYIRARDIKGGKIQTDDLIYIDEIVFNIIKKYIIKSGDIAITIVGASVGDVAYAQEEIDGFNLTENAVRLTEFNSIVDGKYLFYVLNQEQYHEYMQTVAGGAAQPKLGIYKVERIKVFLPPLNIQKEIASILTAYDNLIENNNKRIRLLEQMAENLYKEWFVRFRFPGHEKAEFENGLPKGWKIEKYDKVSTISAGGDKPEFFSQFPTEECNVPIYSNGIVDDGLYGYTNKARINKPCITISARGTVGFVCMRRMPFVPIVRLLAVVPKNDLNVYYLYHSSKYNDLEGNGTSQQQLTVPMLNKRKIVIPINDLLVSFRNKVEPLYNQINMLKKQSVILSRQRDLLLPRLMSGKLEVKA